jgi:hypothetical protein
LFVCFRDKRICNILDLLFIVCIMSISLRVYATTRKTRWPPFGSLIYFRRRQTQTSSSSSRIDAVIDALCNPVETLTHTHTMIY